MHIKIDVASLQREIVFCRHAESVGNAKGRDDNSTSDTPNHQFKLSAVGVHQLEPMRRFLETEFPDGFSDYYVTTFLRTQLTFQGVIGGHITPYEDPRLDEWWKGIFHSLSEQEISRHYPVEHRVLKREGWYHYRPPQGEAGKDVEVRILSFLNSLRPVPRIFICGHGRWYSFLERILLGRPREETDKEAPKNCSIIRLTHDGQVFRKSVLFIP